MSIETTSQSSIYIPPYNGLNAFHEVLKAADLLPTNEEEKKSEKFFKYIARGIAALALFYFSYGFIYYNAICISFKLTASLLSYWKEKKVFHYQHEDYTKDVKDHMQHSIVDIIIYSISKINILYGIFLLLYTIFPQKTIEIANKAIYYKFKESNKDPSEGEQNNATISS